MDVLNHRWKSMATATRFAFVLSACAVPASAQWPQFGGPSRNFVVESEGLADKCAIHWEPLAGTQALVLVTDGLSERGIGVADPARAVADALAAARAEKSDLRPLHACKGVTEAAMEAQRRNNAGDNIATALLWLGD